MQKFIVPQFIDVESKIIGSITTRQFIIIVTGLLFGFVAYKLSDLTLFIIEAFFIGVVIVLFAFARINGAPFHLFLLNYIKTVKSAKVRIWKRQPYVKTVTKDGSQKQVTIKVETARKISTTRLSELSLIIDTGGVYQGEESVNLSVELHVDEKLNYEEQASKK